EAIGALAATHDLDVLTLHGDQPLDVQERALRSGSRRRVVLATKVTETALTVEGVTTVIDSGLARVARLDPRHGINVLRVQPISRASAEQRAGRAGRLAPGRCLRLWSRAEHAGRRAAETPEVLRPDFPPGSSDLELRARLFEDAARQRFAADACRALGLDPGAVRAVERARRQLARLLDATNAATPDPDALRRATLAGFPDRVARRRAAGSPRAVMVGGTGIVLGRESVVREADLFVAVDLERGHG